MANQRRARPRRRGLADHPNYALLREYKATRVSREQMGRLGAHSVGIGRKEVNGKRTNTLALLFYVARKEAVARLSADLVPPEVSFVSRTTKKDARLPTDVIETPPLQFEQDPQTRLRPAPGGASFGIQGSTGTLGGWVWDPTDDTLVALSNNHVLGDTVGTDTLQPGTADGGSLPADKIGDVKRTIPRISPGTNTVDCAISDVDDPANPDLEVIEIGPAVFADEVPVIDMQVEKSGRTTGHTFGEITDADLETTSDGITFDDCLRIVPVSPTTDWSARGDSGSLVFSTTPVSGEIKPVVGLHFGGSGVNGAACKIQNVFAALDIEPICDGFFESFSEALFEVEEEGALEPVTEARLRKVSAIASRRGAGIPPTVTARGRRRARAGRLQAGISRDMQARLRSSRRGKAFTDLVDEHRAELASLLMKDGDLRRAAIAAFRPLVGGATTTTDVLERALTAEDLRRIDSLAREIARRGSPDINRRLKPLLGLRSKAEGRNPAQLLGIKL